MAQNSNTRSTNSSSSTAIGGFADTRGSAGITASASRAKGYANSDTTTYANSQVNVGGTSTFDIGNDLNLKGGVINTNRAQGVIGGDVNIESLQDTATYDSNQKNIGFNADIDIAGGGAGSSLSVNGGKTDINADYKAVGQQSGIFTGDGGFDLDVGGKTTLIGGAITTTDAAVAAGRNNYTSLGGITTQDIENTTSYKGDAIQVGVSLGNTTDKPQATMNGLGYGTDGDSDSSMTRAGITGIAGNSGITTDNRAEYAGAFENVFDEQRVNEELGAQTQITQAFDQERRKIKTEINAKEKKLRDEAQEARNAGDYETAVDKTLAANELQNQGLLFDAISGAIYGPNSNGVTGYVAKAASPFVASQIGDYFKTNKADNKEDGGNRLEPNSPAHILAQGILGAAVSYATGNDALTGGVSAGAGEATAPIISDFLFDTKNPDELTAEQKDTISSITSALGLGIGATTGSASDAANAAETSKVAVEDNHMGGDRNKTNNQLAEDTRKMNERTEELLNALPGYLKNSKLMKNKDGDLIWCLPSSNHSCAPSSELRLATNSEIESAAKSAVTGIAISSVGGAAGGYAVKYASKAVGTYKTWKAARAASEQLAKKWADKIDKVTVPHKRHYLTQVKHQSPKDVNTIVNNNVVDVAKDIKDIKNGLGTPVSDLKIEVNGRTYTRHGDGGNQLIPVSSNNANEIFTLSRGEYHNLKQIMRDKGNIDKTRSNMSRSDAFNPNDFKEAVRIYNLTNLR